MLKVFVAVRTDDPEASPAEVIAKTFDLGYAAHPVDKDGARSFNIGGEITPEEFRALVDALVRNRS